LRDTNVTKPGGELRCTGRVSRPCCFETIRFQVLVYSRRERRQAIIIIERLSILYTRILRYPSYPGQRLVGAGIHINS